MVARHRQLAVKVVGGHIAKWSMRVSDVAEQQKGADMRSLLVSQIHLALLSFKSEINRFKSVED